MERDESACSVKRVGESGWVELDGCSLRMFEPVYGNVALMKRSMEYMRDGRVLYKCSLIGRENMDTGR